MSPAGSGHTGSGVQVPERPRGGGPVASSPPCRAERGRPGCWRHLPASVCPALGVRAGRGAGVLSYSETGFGVRGRAALPSTRAAPFPAALRRSDLTAMAPFTPGVPVPGCPPRAGVAVVVARSRHWNSVGWILPGGFSRAVLRPRTTPHRSALRGALRGPRRTAQLPGWRLGGPRCASSLPGWRCGAVGEVRGG